MIDCSCACFFGILLFFYVEANDAFGANTNQYHCLCVKLISMVPEHNCETIRKTVLMLHLLPESKTEHQFVFQPLCRKKNFCSSDLKAPKQPL